MCEYPGLSNIIAGAYDAALELKAVARSSCEHRRLCERPGRRAAGEGFGAQMRQCPLSFGWRPALHAALRADLFAAWPGGDLAVLRRRPRRRHSGPGAVQGVLPGTLLPGVGEAAGLGRRRDHGVGKNRGRLRLSQHGARRSKRHGRRRHAPAHGADRAPRAARGADRQNDRFQTSRSYGVRRDPRRSELRPVSG